MSGKPWFKSRSMLAQVVSAASTVLTLVIGPEYGMTADQQAAVVTTIALVTNAVSAILRTVTREPIRRR